MRILTLLVASLTAGSAHAHPGHLIELAGHNHWLAGVALGGAIAAGIWGALKGKDKDPEAEIEEIDEEPQEA